MDTSTCITTCVGASGRNGVVCLKALSKTGALALSTFENVILWVTVMKIKDFLGLIWLEIMSDIYENKNTNELRHV